MEGLSQDLWKYIIFDEGVKNMPKDENLGRFHNGFFYIYLSTNKDFTELQGNEVSVFSHEYIHFLQDISTTHGLAHMDFTINELYAINNIVRSSSSKVFTLPLKMPYNVETNKDLFSYYRGTFDYFRLNAQIKVTNIEIKTDYLNNQIQHLDYVVVTFGTTANPDMHELHFGAVAIEESMASIIESHIGSSENQRCLPYIFSEMVCEYIYEPFAKDKALIAGLCELSLMFYNSGIIFITILNEIKKADYVPQNLAELFAYAKRFQFKTNSEVFNYEVLYKKVLADASTQVGKLFTLPPFNNIARWGNQFVLNASQERKDCPWFISKLLCLPKSDAIQYFGTLTKKIGISQIYTDKGIGVGESSLIDNNLSTPILFRCLWEIKRIFNKRDSFNCQLKEYCCVSLPTHIDSFCEKKPWEKANQQYLCPFAQVWKSWGFGNIQLKWK